MGKSNPLTAKSLLIIFTYAPAGFGHLRVTDALYHGLPNGTTTPLLLGSHDTSITILHRFMSIHLLTRMIMEGAQHGTLETIFTFFYRAFLRSHTQLLYEQITTLIEEQIAMPETVLVVATHFGLAHQLAAIKEKIIKQKNVRVVLVVQVTDDSPQQLWYVYGADMIFVPSQKTKLALEQYGRNWHLPLVNFEVLSYPLTPFLNEKLSVSLIKQREQQLDKNSKAEIHLAIPISGAAVGLNFFRTLMHELHQKSTRFVFHIVSKQAPYTKQFISQTQNLSYIDINTFLSDREVVDQYEKLYAREIIALEITKPSEQAFKALFDCEKRGASLLLFYQPIGRQENDNLDFLRRHYLIPQIAEEKQLWDMAKTNKTISKDWLLKSAKWRGISLPEDPILAANFIAWCLKQDIFTAMVSCKAQPANSINAQELNSEGVKKFWQTVSDLLA